VALAAIAVGISLSEAGAPPPRRPRRVGPARHSGTQVRGAHQAPPGLHTSRPGPVTLTKGLLFVVLPCRGYVRAVCRSRQGTKFLANLPPNRSPREGNGEKRFQLGSGGLGGVHPTMKLPSLFSMHIPLGDQEPGHLR
jgi:hypothetical protein